MILKSASLYYNMAKARTLDFFVKKKKNESSTELINNEVPQEQSTSTTNGITLEIVKKEKTLTIVKEISTEVVKEDLNEVTNEDSKNELDSKEQEENVTPSKKDKILNGKKAFLGFRKASETKIDKSSKLQKIETNGYIVFKDGDTYRKYAKDICKETRYDYTKFDPSTSIYDTDEIELNNRGDIPYLFLACALDAVGEVSSRIEKTQRMANCFRAIIHHSKNPKADLLAAIYLCINKLGSDFQGIELGIGESILMKALGETSGKSLENIKKLHNSIGDLGLIAQKVRGKQNLLLKTKPLSISSVFQTFRLIASKTGKNSQQEKVNLIKFLLSSSRDCEPQYIIRSLQGKMRVGLGDETVPISLAHAFVLSGIDKRVKILKESEEIMKSAFAQHPVYDDIIEALFEHGLADLVVSCPLTPGIPVLPMLAKPTKTVQEVFQRLVDSFTLEWKYDGERAQIHILENGSIEIYSRRMERHTQKFPDLIMMLSNCLKENVKSAILDCEVVAYDQVNKRIEPFQILTTRARKDVNMDNIKVSVCLYAFDLLYLNGESFLKKTLRERRKALFSNFQEYNDEFKFVTYKDTSDEDEIRKFLEESVTNNCEGLMVKSLDNNATYEPARRSFNWLKMKKDYIQGLGDSLDLIPIGAYFGTGKRTGVYGGYLLAVYDPHTEEFQSICKIGTGFSDQQLQEFHERLSKNTIPAPYGSYQIGPLQDVPNVWLEPTEVWEVQCADFSLSPIYQAGIGIVDESKGIALRFPRFIRLRDDKSVEDATSAEQVADMYNSQSIIANRNISNSTDD